MQILHRQMPAGETDSVMEAGRAAIARAKRAGRAEITPDDLLLGALFAASRFEVVSVGPWTIDLEAYMETGDGLDGQKVTYAPETAAMFDRAAAIAQRDGAPRMDVVHLLVAFAPEDGGVMGELKRTYGIEAAPWRAALAEWRPPPRGGEIQSSNGNPPELLSPDEVAELLGLHTQTVRGYIRSGKLPAHRLAGERAIRILRRDVFELLEPVSPDEESA